MYNNSSVKQGRWLQPFVFKLDNIQGHSTYYSDTIIYFEPNPNCQYTPFVIIYNYGQYYLNHEC